MQNIFRKEHYNIHTFLHSDIGFSINSINQLTSHIYISNDFMTDDISELKHCKIKNIYNISNALKGKKIIKKYKKCGIKYISVPITNDINSLCTSSYQEITTAVESNQKILIAGTEKTSLAYLVIIYYFVRRYYMLAEVRFKSNPDSLHKKINPNKFALLSIIKFIREHRTCLMLSDSHIAYLLKFEYNIKLFLYEKYKKSSDEEYSSYETTSSESSDQTEEKKYDDLNDLISLCHKM